MSKKILIGMDAEFMAFKEGIPVYPIFEDDLSDVGCDEFGHCVEIRPKESENKEEFLFNIMKKMAELPKDFKYSPMNILVIPKKDYFSLLRAAQRKEIPECKNIYDADILDEGEFEEIARKKQCRVVYCGMHVHMSLSATEEVYLYNKDYPVKGKKERIEIPVDLPVRQIVSVLDDLLFGQLSEAKNFNCGRYRQKGFYETKSSNHFEYRSLGSTAFTPQRVSIIFDIIKEVMGNFDILKIPGTTNWVPKEISDLVYKLSTTKKSEKDLRELWVNWL